MASESSLESPTFRWRHDLWVTTPRPESIDKSTVADVLDERHRAVFRRAMANVLATDIAELTFAQLVDGLPLWEVAIDMSRSDVLNKYQSVPAGSAASKLPLIELIAVAVHALAVQVFTEVDGGFHKQEEWPSDDYYDADPMEMRHKKPTPFLLWLTFDAPEQYPNGVADVAAYWAEDRIFGGVVLFGRGKSGKEQNGVWFHSHRPDVTDHVYALREDQVASLVHFLESEHEEASLCCPFLILADRENVRRDWRLSMPKYKIYRDPWERKMMYSNYDSCFYFSADCREFEVDPLERPELNRLYDSDSD